MQNRENNDEMEQPLPLPPVAPRRQTGDSRVVSESEFHHLGQVISERGNASSRSNYRPSQDT